MKRLLIFAAIAPPLGFVGLVNHERVGVGILRQRASEGWPPESGHGDASGFEPVSSTSVDLRGTLVSVFVGGLVRWKQLGWTESSPGS